MRESVFNIDKYSSDVQSVMTVPPRRLIRMGTMVIFFAFLVILTGSFMVKYPDIVRGEFKLLSNNPPIKLFSKDYGQLHLLVKDGDSVRQDQLIGYLENPANFNDVQVFITMLDSLKYYVLSGQYDRIRLASQVNLGQIQDAYVQFYAAIANYRRYVQQKEDFNYEGLLSKQAGVYDSIDINLQRRYELYRKQDSLVGKKFSRDSTLFETKVISRQELDNADMERTPVGLNKNEWRESILSGQLNKAAMINKKMDFELQDSKTRADLVDRIYSSYNELYRRYSLWKDQYLFVSPCVGKLNLLGIINNHQIVASNQEVFNITYGKTNGVSGYLTVPVLKAGKVEVGQKVLVDLSDFPASEFGFLHGRIISVSEVINNESYVVKVLLNDSLRTDLRRTIRFKDGMIGSGSIITEDLRLFDRFIVKFRELVRRK